MKLKLKGKRKYITGADIISFYRKKLNYHKNLVFNFYKLTSNHLVLRKNLKKNYIKSSLVCVITSSKRDKYTILEKRNKIKERVNYDENKLLKDYKINRKTIIGKNNNSNFFDYIVVLNKKLLSKLIGKYKWIFCKLEIKRLNNLNFNIIRIELIDKSKNFYTSKIIIKREIVGKIFFYKK